MYAREQPALLRRERSVSVVALASYGLLPLALSTTLIYRAAIKCPDFASDPYMRGGL